MDSGIFLQRPTVLSLANEGHAHTTFESVIVVTHVFFRY
jgi:hypothetical protein